MEDDFHNIWVIKVLILSAISLLCVDMYHYESQGMLERFNQTAIDAPLKLS